MDVPGFEYDEGQTIVRLSRPEVDTMLRSKTVNDIQRGAMDSKEPHDVYANSSVTQERLDTYRQSYVNGVIIQSRGLVNKTSCEACAKMERKGRCRPFADCRSMAGFWKGACANCKWNENGQRCTLFEKKLDQYPLGEAPREEERIDPDLQVVQGRSQEKTVAERSRSASVYEVGQSIIRKGAKKEDPILVDDDQ
ncbi:MAG: hypothetical protein M1820_005490 [Bogoriella megaspora]|nr:MAG: hypothetical protein M1820_005490 [Bogoriella megaspora]